MFQSTPPRRRRPPDPPRQFSRHVVSIHASAKEATPLPTQDIRRIEVFQSTPPRRRRPVCIRIRPHPFSFNPRLREGGDFFARFQNVLSLCFNPRLREGGDQKDRSDWVDEDVSIHASAKEATLVAKSMSGKDMLFQSTPPRRRRPITPISGKPV